jgi:LAO/AO transport system kinase
MDIPALVDAIRQGDRRSIARAISLVENDAPEAAALLESLSVNPAVPVFGITGPPGAGKSTLINSLLKELTAGINEKGQPIQVAVVAVDPTSPFTRGSLLGDRLRMHEFFNSSQVFIRSLATRGALGGLSARCLEVCDVLRSAGFDYIFVETVGVGQSEVEIVGLADTVAVILVPEAGDEIQALKSGIMEIGDLFVINKADRDGADLFAAGIIRTLHERPDNGRGPVPVLKTIAHQQQGIAELLTALKSAAREPDSARRIHLMAQRAFRLIQARRMKDLSVQNIEEALGKQFALPGFNLYRFVAELT